MGETNGDFRLSRFGRVFRMMRLCLLFRYLRIRFKKERKKRRLSFTNYNSVLLKSHCLLWGGFRIGNPETDASNFDSKMSKIGDLLSDVVKEPFTYFFFLISFLICIKASSSSFLKVLVCLTFRLLFV